MRDVEIKLTGVHSLSETEVYVDDKPVKFKKNEFKNLVCKYSTESEKINIKVFKMLDIGGAVWFITQLFFFLISIFGLLDIHHRQRCMVIDFEMDVDLKEENKITLQFNSPQEDKDAIEIQTDLVNRVITNKYCLDVKAKKTLKALLITKIILALAIIATTIIILMVKL